MKSRRLIALAFGTCLFVVAPTVVVAQGTGAPAGTGTGTSSSSSATSSATTKSSSVTPITMSATNSGNGTATGTPSTTNPFVNWYGDPLSMGLASKWVNGPPSKPTSTFGKGNYTTTTTTSSGGASTVPTQQNGFTTYGVVRNPPYSTGLSSEIPMVVHITAELQSDIRATIDRSSFVKSQATVQVAVNDGVVVLTGQVASDREFRLIEGMARTTGGVRDVVNELKVVPTK